MKIVFKFLIFLQLLVHCLSYKYFYLNSNTIESWQTLIFEIRDYYGGTSYITTARDPLVNARFPVVHQDQYLRIIVRRDQFKVEFILRTSDLYFVGWVNNRRGFRFADVTDEIFENDSDLTQIVPLQISSDYRSLGLESKSFSVYSLDGAVTYFYSHFDGTGRYPSEPFLAVAVVISEAARFNEIYLTLSQGQEITFEGRPLQLVRSWQSSSTDIVNTLCLGRPPPSVTVTGIYQFLIAVALLQFPRPSVSNFESFRLVEDGPCKHKSVVDFKGVDQYLSREAKESDSDLSCSPDFMNGRVHDGDENGRSKLKCLKISVSAVGIKSKITPIKSITGSQIKESNSVFECPKNTAIVRRLHKGDENGKTLYECAYASVEGRIINILHDNSYSVEMKESKSSFECPAQHVVAGRKHKGDENGLTSYLCGEMMFEYAAVRFENNLRKTVKESTGEWAQFNDRSILTGMAHDGDENGNTQYYWQYGYMQDFDTSYEVQVENVRQFNVVEESNSNFNCPDNTFVVERRHEGDENGKTQYKCAALKVVLNDDKVLNAVRLSDYVVGPQKQSDSSLHCKGGAIYGRKHDGDENGDTLLYCSIVGFHMAGARIE